MAASIQSSDGTTTVSASFGTAAAYLSASGGGRVGNIHYYYTFSGNFSVTEVINGVSGAIRGETSESMDSVTTASGSAPACCGSAGVNSAYTPVYISDYSFSRLVRADDLWGTNQQIPGSAESLIFSTEPVGLKSSAQSVTLANSGAGSVSITGTAFKGDFLGGRDLRNFARCGSKLRRERALQARRRRRSNRRADVHASLARDNGQFGRDCSSYCDVGVDSHAHGASL